MDLFHHIFSFKVPYWQVCSSFDGIKMGARVAVNGVEIGNATDQF